MFAKTNSHGWNQFTNGSECDRKLSNLKAFFVNVEFPDHLEIALGT